MADAWLVDRLAASVDPPSRAARRGRARRVRRRGRVGVRCRPGGRRGRGRASGPAGRPGPARRGARPGPRHRRRPRPALAGPAPARGAGCPRRASARVAAPAGRSRGAGVGSWRTRSTCRQLRWTRCCGAAARSHDLVVLDLPRAGADRLLSAAMPDVARADAGGAGTAPARRPRRPGGGAVATLGAEHGRGGRPASVRRAARGRRGGRTPCSCRWSRRCGDEPRVDADCWTAGSRPGCALAGPLAGRASSGSPGAPARRGRSRDAAAWTGRRHENVDRFCWNGSGRELASDPAPVTPGRVAAAVRARPAPCWATSGCSTSSTPCRPSCSAPARWSRCWPTPTVTDVLVNGAGVWVDRGARGGAGARAARWRGGGPAPGRRLAAAAGRRLDDASPCVDARLPGRRPAARGAAAARRGWHRTSACGCRAGAR